METPAVKKTKIQTCKYAKETKTKINSGTTENHMRCKLAKNKNKIVFNRDCDNCLDYTI